MSEYSRREFLERTSAVALSPKLNKRNEKEPLMEQESAVEVLAYYFPQYHPDPRNNAWHGKGWTEWDLVKAAKPRYPGHYQPIVPTWGYFDESDPKWTEKEIDLAADNGVTGFIYDWYYYEDGGFLMEGLEKGFLKAKNSERLKFALMWANHDWINIHPAKFSEKPETLATGRVSKAGFERITDYVIKEYFPLSNYLKIDGKPYFSIYETGTFIGGLGGLDAAKEALQLFQKKAQKAGFPGVHINGVVWGVSVLPVEVKIKDPVHVVRELGIESVTSYAWVHHYDPNTHGFPKGSYARAAERNAQAWEEYREKFPIPYYPNVSMGWDPSPRTIQSDVFEARGYPWTSVLEGNTPAAFKQALVKAKTFLQRSETKSPILTINAWNEWTEGSYLLPDTKHGTDYLKAIKQVFGTRKGEEDK